VKGKKSHWKALVDVTMSEPGFCVPQRGTRDVE
jgi:hypothetical protein